MTGLKLRTMVEADVDQVHGLEVESSQAPWSRELLAGEFEGDLSDRIWWVAEHEAEAKGGLIGFGGVLLLADEAHVMNLVVDPGYRRCGVASRLLAALLIESVDRGACDATLEVRASNESARRLYEQRFGFVVAGRRPGYYRADETREDALIMWSRKLYRPDRISRLQQLSEKHV